MRERVGGSLELRRRNEIVRFENFLEVLFSGGSRVLGTVREIGNPKCPHNGSNDGGWSSGELWEAAIGQESLDWRIGL